MSETYKESFKVAGQQLVEAVKKLVHEGNVRRVIIKHGDHTIAEFPLTVGVIGAVLAAGGLLVLSVPVRHDAKS